MNVKPDDIEIAMIQNGLYVSWKSQCTIAWLLFYLSLQIRFRGGISGIQHSVPGISEFIQENRFRSNCENSHDKDI
jgi:hypothetical protein